MTSENAAEGPQRGTETTSENTDRAPAGLFSSTGGDPAPDRARLPKATTSALIDPFTLPGPHPVADTDPQPSASDFLYR